MTAAVRILALACALSVSAVAAPAAYADDAKAQKREAQRHFDAGKRFIKQKSFDEAIAELQRAYELDPRTEHLYNLAVAHHLKGDAEQAMKFYRAFLAESPSGKAARDAQRFLSKLEAAEAERQAKLAAERAEADKLAAAEEQRAEEARRVVQATARAEEA
ncbi:MAG: tetratricopeptide repeat protein, partial [Deltaproteobacteria bacterium]|nr:tetratricopeptide repeat protein [Kofleriaceae bacterium]